jgi:hypothetical protein
MSLFFSPIGGAAEGTALGVTDLATGAGFGSEIFFDSTGFVGSVCLAGIGKLTNDTSTDVNGRSP